MTSPMNVLKTIPEITTRLIQNYISVAKKDLDLNLYRYLLKVMSTDEDWRDGEKNVIYPLLLQKRVGQICVGTFMRGQKSLFLNGHQPKWKQDYRKTLTAARAESRSDVSFLRSDTDILSQTEIGESNKVIVSVTNDTYFPFSYLFQTCFSKTSSSLCLFVHGLILPTLLGGSWKYRITPNLPNYTELHLQIPL